MRNDEYREYCECITSITRNAQFIVFDISTRCRKAINLVFPCSDTHVMPREEGFVLASSIRRGHDYVCTYIYTQA